MSASRRHCWFGERFIQRTKRAVQTYCLAHFLALCQVLRLLFRLVLALPIFLTSLNASADPIFDPGLSLNFMRDEAFGQTNAAMVQLPIYRRGKWSLFTGAAVGRTIFEPNLSPVINPVIGDFGGVSAGFRYDLNSFIQFEGLAEARHSTQEQAFGVKLRSALDVRAVQIDFTSSFERYEIHQRLFDQLSQTLMVATGSRSGIRGAVDLDLVLRDVPILPPAAELLLSAGLRADYGPAPVLGLRRRNYGEIDAKFLTPLGPERDLFDERPPSQFSAEIKANTAGEVDAEARADIFLSQWRNFDLFAFGDYRFEKKLPSVVTSLNEFRLGLDQQWTPSPRHRFNFEQGVGYSPLVSGVLAFVTAGHDWRISNRVDLTNRIELYTGQRLRPRFRSFSALRYTDRNLRASAFVELDEVSRQSVRRVSAGGELNYSLRRDLKQLADLSASYTRNWETNLDPVDEFSVELNLHF